MKPITVPAATKITGTGMLIAPFHIDFPRGAVPLDVYILSKFVHFVNIFRANSYLFVRKYEHIFICFALFLKTKKYAIQCIKHSLIKDICIAITIRQATN